MARASLVLFLIINGMYFTFALLSPLAHRWKGTRIVQAFGLVFSPRTDRAVYGAAGDELIANQPALLVLRVVIYDMLAGLYFAVGVLHMAVAWFGLRQGHDWALLCLTIADAAIPLAFVLAVHTYSKHVIDLRFNDLFPYILVPLAVLPFAAACGFAAQWAL